MNSEFIEEERVVLARMVLDIFRDWELTPELQLILLGIPDRKERELTKFKHGKPLPDLPDLMDRVKHIIGIQRSLHSNYPLNHNMPSFWIRNRNRSLKGIPLAIMADGGLTGMHRVWRHLDCTINWEN